MSQNHQPATDRTALVLTGGGARAAYQVGVLKAAAELLPKRAPNPFSIITGTSAGAINSVALGASANNFRLAVKKVERLWTTLHVEDVYKSGYRDLIRSIYRLVSSMFHQGVGVREPVALLDSSPLAELLERVINFDDLERRLAGGQLDAIGVTASCYDSGESVTFYQSDLDGSVLPQWRRARRHGIATRLEVQHLLASSAIPMILPAAKVGDSYYGDGALRQVSPISPALHMGAERIMVVGVSGNASRPPREDHESHSPSLGRMIGHVFNSAFIDALESDMEHLARINNLVGMLQNDNPHLDTGGVKMVDFLCINPSMEIDQMVARHFNKLPRATRRMLSITGATPEGGGASLASYLMFEGDFCKELIQCGYHDAMEQKEMLSAFFHPPGPVSL